MRILVLVVATLLSSFSYAQNFKKHFNNYTSLTVSRGIDATLVKSNSKDLTFTTHGIDPAGIIVENRGDELRIKITTKALWEEMQENHWWVRVEVPYDKLASLDATTGAKIQSAESINTDRLDVSVSMGAKMELSVKVNNLDVDASMGSSADLAGTVESLKVNANMGSVLDMDMLTATYIRAKSSMGSELKVHATKEFDGHATMGGTIDVTGNPERFYANTGMGGDIFGGDNN